MKIGWPSRKFWVYIKKNTVELRTSSFFEVETVTNENQRLIIILLFSSQSAHSNSSSSQQSKEIHSQHVFVILTFQLTDGQTHTYRLSINKFHELRYTVASALKSIIVLEKRNCMRNNWRIFSWGWRVLGEVS